MSEAWQHIEFIDGSNPYICKTEKEFKRMKERYVLEEIKDGFWRAKYSISYLLVGFADKTKMATFHKEYKTRSGAMRSCKKLLRNEYESVVLRREEKYLKNNERLEISISTPIKTFTMEEE